MDNEEEMGRNRTSNQYYYLSSFPGEVDDDSSPPVQNPLSPPLYPFFIPNSIITHPSTSTFVTNPSTSTSSTFVTSPSATTLLATSLTSTTLVATPSIATPLIVHRRPDFSTNFRTRRNSRQAPRGGKSETIPAPYPWATNRRATVHSLDHLLKIGQRKISGEVQCKRCERKDEIEFDLKSKFYEVAKFISVHKSNMHDRAPKEWSTPLLPTCKYCARENSVKPIIAPKKKEINWLFLLLGQMLGCCTLNQLKYFCKHTKNHRTGAKDRVLYLTYLSLCKQLDHSTIFYH